MSCIFSSADNFNGDVSGWDASNVADMSWMFGNTINFNDDLSGWDISNASDMSFMLPMQIISTEGYLLGTLLALRTCFGCSA